MIERTFDLNHGPLKSLQLDNYDWKSFLIHAHWVNLRGILVILFLKMHIFVPAKFCDTRFFFGQLDEWFTDYEVDLRTKMKLKMSEDVPGVLVTGNKKDGIPLKRIGERW